MKNTRRIYLILIVAVVMITAVLALVWTLKDNDVKSVPEPAITTAPVKQTKKIVEVEKIIEVEKKISGDIIQDGLRDMGFLVTEEYYFTEVVSYSSVKKLFKTIKLGITESSYLASYDGVISAGLDFEKISVEKNDEERIITIRLPKSEVKYMQIDPESFVLYSEKEGLGNKISLSDYNDSLIELEKNAEKKAVDRGLLKRADDNAKLVISNFVNSLVDTSDYMVRYIAD
ncbi:MAG: DUF4230 domain-containing protein [Oscillospiraceae bacterium]|nr:DUF4230 domain-containing protein [Oscillospiraceae bacterium]